MNVGVLVVLAGTRPRNGLPADALVRRMLRCPVGAPFNQRLASGMVAGWPVLVQDDAIDPAQQLFRHRLPDGSDLQALFDRVCQIHPRRLDRSRPLWEMHVFDGLAKDQHRAVFQDSSWPDRRDRLHPRGVEYRVQGRRGAPAPGALAGLAAPPRRAKGGRVDDRCVPCNCCSPAWQAGRTARDLARLAWHLGRRDLGLGRGMATPFVTTPDVLKAPPSPNRVLGHCSLPLERVRAIARAGRRQDQRRAARDARHRAAPLPDRAWVARAPATGRRHARGPARGGRRRQPHHDPASPAGPSGRHSRAATRRNRGRDAPGQGRGPLDQPRRAVHVFDHGARGGERHRSAEPR